MTDETRKNAAILIAGDDEAHILELEHILQRQGYTHFRHTLDPLQVRTLIAEFRPDLLLLDPWTHDAQGQALLDQLRSLIPAEAHLPILALTGDLTPEARQQALAGGVKDFVTMPFDDAEVLLRIENLLETRLLHLQLQNQNQLLEEKVRARTALLAQAEETEREQRRLAEALRDTAAKLNSTIYFDKVLDRLLENVGRIVPYDAASIMLVDTPAGVARVVRRQIGAEARRDTPLAARPFPVADTPSLHHMAETGQPLIISDTHAYPGWVTVPWTGWVRSYAGAPILQGGRLTGFLNITSATPGFFTPTQSRSLQALADQAAIALENARLYESERRQYELAEALRDTAAALNSTLNFDEVLDIILTTVGRVVPYDTADVMLVDAPAGVARVTRSQGYAEQGLGEWITAVRLSVADTPSLRHMADTGQPLIIPDTHAYSGWVDFPETHWLRSYAGAPIRIHEQTVGFLNLSDSMPGLFTQAHAEGLRAFAVQAASAIVNARLYAELEQALRQEQATRAQLVQADKLSALGRMVASVAHELNNPLQTITNCLFLAQHENAPGSPTNEYLTTALSETQRLANLVLQLREVYRPSLAGQMQQLSVPKLLEEVQLLVVPHLARSRVRWQSTPASVPIEVNAAPGQLKQVFLNLSLNAAEAMQPDGGTLTANVFVATDIRQAGIAFQDTGRGIAPEHLPHLFEPFFTTKETGAGLGLAISYDIVQKHGGRLTVDSQPGQGATFTVWLPLAKEEN